MKHECRVQNTKEESADYNAGCCLRQAIARATGITLTFTTKTMRLDYSVKILNAEIKNCWA